MSPELFDYVAARTAPDDEFMRRLKQQALEAGIPAIWIAPEQASFMQLLLKAIGAREVIEVGTLAGYSAIAMARALPPEGRVRTIELSESYADFAERQIARSDVAGRVEVYRGDGAHVLRGFADNSADASFIDADKPNYPVYLEESLRIVRRGGMIMADNAFAFGQVLEPGSTDPHVQAVRTFNDVMAATPGLHGIIVPLGDGLWVVVKEH